MVQRTRPHVPLSVVLTAVACVAGITAVAAIFYWVPRTDSSFGNPGGGSGGTLVEVLDYELITTYNTNNSSDTNYLPSPVCPVTDCPFNASPGSEVLFNLSLTNSDPIAHQITGVALDSPFDVLGTVPSLPLTLDPNVPTPLQVEVRAPSTPDSYAVMGSITTQ